MAVSAVPERIETDRLLIVRHNRALSEKAAEAIAESLNELLPWQPWARKFDGLDSCLQYSDWLEPQWGRRFDYQILDKDGRFIGQANLEAYRPEVPSIMVGYWLRTSATGQGYATETATALKRVAFEALGVARFELLCDVRSRKSAAVAKRLGLTLEGILRSERRDSAGQLQDTMVWSMTALEFRSTAV